MKKTLVILTLAACLLLAACSSHDSGSAGNSYAPSTAADTHRSELDKTADKGGTIAGSAETSYQTATTAPAASPAGGSGVTGAGDQPSIPDDGRKLIRTGYYNLETLDYPKTIEDIEALVNSVGGYVQYSTHRGGAGSGGYQSPRYATYVLRVPAEAFFAVGHGLDDIAVILNSEHSVEEVTDTYYDTEARLTTLRVQEERLLALMSQATELEAIIQLEQRLADVRYSIESYEGTLRRLDSQIGFSTITVYVQEVFEPTVIEPTPVTLGQRIASRFKYTVANIKWGFESFVVAVLGDGLSWLINLAVLALIGFVVWKVIKAAKNARARRELSQPSPRKRGGKAQTPAAPEDGESSTKNEE